jgi:hypothetical protein
MKMPSAWLVCLAACAAYLSGLYEPCAMEPNVTLSLSAYVVAGVALAIAILRNP